MDTPDGTLNPSRTERREGRGRFVRLAAGYVVGAACLVWLFHDVHPREILSSVARFQWQWAALAIVFDILSYICQGGRWRLLLHPLGEIGILKTTQAIYAGLFASEVLPMRFGEVVRMYLVSRWLHVDFAELLSSIVVERLFDGVWLALSIGIAAIFVPVPENLLDAADVFGAIILATVMLFVFLVMRRRKGPSKVPVETATVWKPIRLATRMWRHMEDGLWRIGLSREFWGSFGLSLAMLAVQAVSFWLMMLACGLWMSFWTGTVVLLIVHLGTTIPNAPANVGTYQFFVVIGLSLFGVDKASATAFSCVVFFFLTLPLWLIGFFSLSRSGMTLASIRQEVHRLGR
ncbi:MAG: flippase-like domain-containing protein [Acidobacteriales bacterium]|nr:flippase-like domain-containing protein [Terriglobales bacterium]